jgi:hypothetical protein
MVLATPDHPNQHHLTGLLDAVNTDNLEVEKKVLGYRKKKARVKLRSRFTLLLMYF